MASSGAQVGTGERCTGSGGRVTGPVGPHRLDDFHRALDWNRTDGCRFFVDPILGQHFRDPDEGADAAGPQPVFEVRYLAQVFVPAPDLIEKAATKECPGPRRADQFLDHAAVVIVGRPNQASALALAIDEIEVAVGDERIGLRLQGADERRNGMRQEQVVGTQIAKVLTASTCPSLIQRSRLACVGVPLPIHAAGVAVQHIGRGVGGAIINDDVLDVRIVLRKDAVERGSQEFCLVVARRDDADERRSGSCDHVLWEVRIQSAGTMIGATSDEETPAAAGVSWRRRARHRQW